MKRIVPTHFAALLIALLLTNLTEGNETNHGENLIKWLNEEGGHVNDKIEIRRADPSDATSRFGVFTNSDIKRNEIILDIPTSCLLSGAKISKKDKNDDDEEEDNGAEMDCDLVRNLITEMKLGDDSKYAPYVNYLLAEPWGQLPSAWSEEGRVLLIDMLGQYTVDPIPPIEPEDWLDEWHVVCNGSHDPFEENASLVVVQRSWDDVLIPVYDMMSHRNGQWHNTKSNSVRGDSNVVVKAKRDIKTGEELYTSYNMCEDCGNRKDSYGTPEILRDYGFIEQYPQRWIFPEAIGFQIDEKKEGSGILTLSWIGKKPTVQDYDGLRDVKEGMKMVAKTLLNNPSGNIPPNEIATIRQFHEAITKATDLAIKVAYTDDEACDADDDVCVVPSSRYDDLSDNKDMDYNVDVCDIDANMEFKEYDDIGQFKTQYQKMTVIHNYEDKDTCFDLDGTTQICANYRPHYHEMSVHYAARYLERIKRVLFVGGGDSMLLHEILKYPSIESIVGLELDQKVVRTSFKYFGTQPHWDNDKVEWWFGDATKSLLMLPKEYFGSFDMVLVDLSETVMSYKVTTGLDIMETLSLLLTPDGIMLKNELYFGDMSNIFGHTVQYFYYGVPVICSQSMVIGSNSINFLRPEKLTDHNVDNLLIGPLDYEKHFGLYNDYAWNPDNVNKQCMRDDDPLNKAPVTQSNSPGIIMIVEAENAPVMQKSSKDMAELVADTLKNEGFTVMSKIVPESEDEGDISIVVINGGYVVSHYWPDFKYYGFDIYLWGSFGKQEILKKALLSAVGSSSKSSSSFRIVTGGMFGTRTWKSDEEARGPRRTHVCDRSEPTIPDLNTDINIIETIFEQNMKFIEQDATVLVVCGLKSSQACSALDTLQKNDRVGESIDVWSCPNINEFEKNSASERYACERDLIATLRKRLGKDKKLEGIVFDQAVSYSMGQILVRIFKNLKSKVDFLASNPTVIAISDSETKTWRSGLINRFRTDIIIYDPVFKADILVEGVNTNIGVHVVVSHKRSISLLREILTSIEELTGVRTIVEEILGGTPNYDHEFSPDHEYKPDDYDQTSSLDQMISQRPLEYQTIFQLEVKAHEANLQRDEVRDAVEQALFSILNISPKLDVFSDLGDGCLLIALWSGGRVVIVWDGRKHIDINLSTSIGSDTYFDKFEKTFIEQLPRIKTILRDEQPRGYGRVINFPQDILKVSELFWA